MVTQLTPIILKSPSKLAVQPLNVDIKPKGQTGRRIKRVSRSKAKTDAKDKRAIKRQLETNKAIASLKLQI